MPFKDILRLDDADFLRLLVKRYPEMSCLTGKADASPEGISLLRPDALTYQVFAPGSIDPSAIEAERTLVALLTLKWVMTGDYDGLTAFQDPAQRLTRNSFDQLRSYTANILHTDADMEVCFYALACNDLGKTQHMSEAYQECFGTHAEDHDKLLCRLTEARPDFFPAFDKLLSHAQKADYLAGLRTDLNLGQFVLGECLPFNLLGAQKETSRRLALRLVCEIYDFAGARGHVNHNGSLTMTENAYQAFFHAIKSLSQPDAIAAYRNYLGMRAEMTGLSIATAKGFALTRLICMGRIFQKNAATILINAFDALPRARQENLVAELNVTGMSNCTGILLYYAPALIANALAATDDAADAFQEALILMDDAYIKTRQSMPAGSSGGVLTIDLAHMANAFRQRKKAS